MSPHHVGRLLRRGVAVAVALVLAMAGATSAVSTPAVRLTLQVSPNPAASDATVVYTGTVTPTNGTVPSFMVILDRTHVSACTPVADCTVDRVGHVSWMFTDLTTAVTITATAQPLEGQWVGLYPNTDGVTCLSGCPAGVVHVRPVDTVRLSYSGPTPVTTGSVVHVTASVSTDAPSVQDGVVVELPAGLSDPANLTPGATWYASGRQVQLGGTVDPILTVTFDTTVTAPVGSVLTLTARNVDDRNGGVDVRSVTVNVGSSSPPMPGVLRLAGRDRYATAAAISDYQYPLPYHNVFIATGQNFPDALTAGPVAFLAGQPLLLVSRDAIPQSVVDVLRQIQPSQITVVGGPPAVSENVVSQLRSYAGYGVRRLLGRDRYATGAIVVGDGFHGYTGPVFIATGANYPDALAGGAAAERLVAPLILSQRDALPAATQGVLAGMSPTRFILLGSATVLSSSLTAQLQSLYPGVPVTRLAGHDRYATSAAIAKYAFPSGARTVFLATGLNFPDALAGAAIAGNAPGPILLAAPDCLPPPVYERLQALQPDQIVLLGGPSVLADTAPSTECPG